MHAVDQGDDLFEEPLPGALVREAELRCRGIAVRAVLFGEPLFARQARAANRGERDPFRLETSVRGIFAAGNVRNGSIKRVASGVGEGSMAIAFVHQYLADDASATSRTARLQTA